MPGIASGASAAVQGPVHGLVTTDAQGNLASDGGALQGQVDRIEGTTEENSEGIAMALAMSGALPELLTGETMAVAGHWGTFEGENGVAFGARVRVSDGFSLAGGVGAGLDNGSVGGTVGGRFGW